MEIRSFVAPVIQDREALEEFADALNDRAPEIERDVARLKETPLDKEITASLFRAVHNIKGDSSLCKFDLGVAIAHPIETMMGRFREGEIPFSDLLAELVLLAVDRLELATDACWPINRRKISVCKSSFKDWKRLPWRAPSKPSSPVPS